MTKKTWKELERKYKNIKKDRMFFMVVIVILMFFGFYYSFEAKKLETQLSECQEQVYPEMVWKQVGITGTDFDFYIDGIKLISEDEERTYSFWIQVLKSQPIPFMEIYIWNRTIRNSVLFYKCDNGTLMNILVDKNNQSLYDYEIKKGCEIIE